MQTLRARREAVLDTMALAEEAELNEVANGMMFFFTMVVPLLGFVYVFIRYRRNKSTRLASLLGFAVQCGIVAVMNLVVYGEPQQPQPMDSRRGCSPLLCHSPAPNRCILVAALAQWRALRCLQHSDSFIWSAAVCDAVRLICVHSSLQSACPAFVVAAELFLPGCNTVVITLTACADQGPRHGRLLCPVYHLSAA